MRVEPKLAAGATPLASRSALLRKHPAAHALSLYDGRVLCGFIVADDDNWRRARCWAFDAADVPLGEFPNRRDAMRAVATTGTNGGVT